MFTLVRTPLSVDAWATHTETTYAGKAYYCTTDGHRVTGVTPNLKGGKTPTTFIGITEICKNRNGTYTTSRFKQEWYLNGKSVNPDIYPDLLLFAWVKEHNANDTEQGLLLSK
jgi:hypothetical protein